jgi:hypothetical protein
MVRIRDPRAAALAALLAVLGAASTAMGLQTEATTLPPAAAGETPPRADPAQPAETSPTPSKLAPTGTTPSDTDQPSTDDDALPAPPPATSPAAGAKTGSGMKRSEPVRLEIPAIKLKTDVRDLGLRNDGTLEVPPLRAAAPAGWYRGSPTPGETGAAVLIGHVDSAREGPAVFFRLREVDLGDPISVRRSDGTVARFQVYRVATYPKHEFPSADVYGPVDRAELRLITCGGSFDRDKRSYRDNVVVFGSPLS